MEQIVHFSATEELYKLNKPTYRGDDLDSESNRRAIEKANDWLKANKDSVKIVSRSLATDANGYVSIIFAYVSK